MVLAVVGRTPTGVQGGLRRRGTLSATNIGVEHLILCRRVPYKNTPKLILTADAPVFRLRSLVAQQTLVSSVLVKREPLHMQTTMQSFL